VSSSSISPTAHYTGYVWARNGLSHPRLSTLEGRLMFDSLQPAMIASRLVGGPTLEGYLLARHRTIDALLERAIEDDGVTQVIEVAAGLSPRGWRFASRYGERLTYVEADLAGMIARKRRALEQMGSLGEHHRVVEVDALREDGPGSIAALAAELDRAGGLAIITEGLLSYLPGDAVDGLWRRFASALSEFSTGVYLSDLHLGTDENPAVQAFRAALSVFVRSRVRLHYQSADDAVAALLAAGFARARLHSGGSEAGDSGSRLAHIIEASTSP
jgi:O-methyltransferase involved in polyketide biosynthesis